MRNPISVSVLLSVVLAVGMIGVLTHFACGCKKSDKERMPAKEKVKEFRKMPKDKDIEKQDDAVVPVIEVE